MDRCLCCGLPKESVNGVPHCNCTFETRSSMDGKPMQWCVTHQRAVLDYGMPAIVENPAHDDFPAEPTAL